MTTRTIALAGFMAFAMTGPALSADVNYTCRDGTRFMASFSPPTGGPGTVVLDIAGSDTKVTLPQVKSADGGRYANADMEFWIRGKNATLTRAGRGISCESK
jgi:membrane-bound inhibitor of C-type lysozyme